LVDIEIAIADIERARTVFEWSGAEKPGKPAKKAGAKKSASKKSESKEPSHTEASAS